MWLRLIKPLDDLIDGITMYRLLMYYLLGLLAAAIGLSLVGDLHYNPLYIAVSATVLVLSCWIINKVFAYIFHAPINPESSILTGLILTLIIPPVPTGYGFLFLLAASGLAIASKYILTIRKKHIFNPAAIAVVLTALGPQQNASWWVGTAALLPFVLIGGILITRKVRRERMVISFLASTTAATALYSFLSKTSVPTSIHNMILSSSVFFLAFVMLTEPYTSPATRGKQTWYAIIVGALVPPQAHLFSYYTSPEIALVIGNIFAYIVSPKTKLFPVLREKYKIATNTLEFVFIPGQKLAYEPGQYMEWTLPHPKTDSRGARRYFTLASSPTEQYVRLGIKFYEKGSSYKTAMLDMDHNTPIVAAQVAGDFVMPKNTERKLAFIAGGIGITPFRSMVKYLLDKGQSRNIDMLYSARTELDFAYRDIFELARQKFGLNTQYIVSDRAASITKPHSTAGTITSERIRRTIPDYAERLFYISGTHAMVEAMQEALGELGVSTEDIKTDFFPGYARKK
jgi:ferredoxin-NADP reductase/Na+-translocating ferredoxin:NAD+ oxidoreductase RnfD subunit